MKRVSLHIFFSLFMLMLAATQGFSQVSVNTANFVYLQNFDGYTGTNISTVPQWTANGSFTYRGVGNGSSNTGGAWAYGTGSGASSERALGYLGSGTSSSIIYGVSFVNNTGGPITQLQISYDFEQWRFESGNTLGWTVQGTGALSAVSVSGLNSNSVTGNSSGTVQVTPKAIVLTGLNILPNATFGLQWSCSNGAGNDNGVAIDNFHLAVICAPKFASVDTTLCAGAAFVVNGNTYTTPQVVSDTLLAANGCDSIVNYNLNFLPAITHSFSDTTCFGTTYSWGNQNLTTSGSYNHTFTSATSCDSVVTLNLFVRPAITYSFADTVCAAASYNWGNQNLTTSGSYNHTFTSATSCDSVVTLNLFVRPAITYSFADTVCAAATYAWGNQNLTASGSYNHTFTSATNCDSVVTLNLFVRPAITYSFADTVCAAATYAWGNQNLTTSDSYNHTFTSATSCDSVVTLNLFVRPAINYSFADTVCAAATYAWGNQNLTTSGSYNHTFTSATNCDSVVTLNLFVRPAITYSFADTVCAAATYAWGNQNLTASGSYNHTFTSATNCDSVVTLNLFVRPAITYSFADTVCAAATYAWGNQNLTTSGSYNHTFTSATNCDSVVTLNLFVRPAITYSFADTVCAAATYAWGNQNLTTSDSYNHTFTSATNCDSVVTLNLFVRPAITYSFADTVCAAATYNWANQNLTTSGSYNHTFTSATSCDSVVTLNLFVRPAITYSFADTVCAAATYAWGNQNLTTSGSYNHNFTSATNCDSVVTLNLFVRPAITYSFADTVCAAATYAWGNQNLTASSSYNHTFTSATSCDSVVTLNLFVRPANNTAISQSICSGTSYSFGSQLLTTSGVYTGSFQAINGCDSNVTLTLNVGSLITNSFADTICAATTYNWVSQNLTASGSYNHTFTSATSCDSVVTLNLFVLPAITYSFADTVCAAATYAWSNQNLTTSGSYNHTFTSATSCDSVVTLNLFVRPAITYSFADTVCAAATYNWGNQNLTTSGSYNHTFTSATNCDSVVTLNLFVRPAITYSFADTICATVTYSWASQNFTASGSYNQTFTSAAGCDSVVTLNLFVRPANNTAISQSICSGTSYSFGSQLLTTSGVYTGSFQAINGCDSNVTLTLNVGSLITNSFADTICAATTYNWVSQNLTASGSYNQTFTSATSCDSVVTLNLFVRPAITYSFADTVCAAATYAWSNQNLTTSGSYNHTFTSATSCDSVVTLNLFVRPAITYSFADTICATVTYSWASQNLTASGSYNQTFTSAAGCDSVVTLNLFVRPANNTAISQSICSGTSYSFGSQLLTTSGVYTGSFQAANGCDSNVTLTLNVGSLITNSFADTICAATTYNWVSQNLTASGSYNQTFTSATGCDSVVTLNLFVRPGIAYSFADTICATVTYSWGSQNLTASGSYNQTFTSATGCDSVATLNLFVRPGITYSFADTICATVTYSWGSLNLTASGSYNQTFPDANGCDSLVILHLNVRSLISDTVQASICYGATYILGSQNLSASGYYSAIFISATGCDSIVALHLQVSTQPATVTIDTAACEKVWFEGIPYTSFTTLTDTFSTVLGCDSIYRIVHIAPHANNPVVQTIDTASCGPLAYGGNVYTESISLADTLFSNLGCDSIIRVVNIKISSPETRTVVHEMCAGNTFTFSGHQYNIAGSYPFSFKNQAGCDSVVVLELSINPLPQVEITVDANRNYCAGDSLMLQGVGAQFYSWIYQDVDTFEGDYFRTLLFHYKNDFLLTGTDNNGCSNTASIHIDAQACCSLWMPNAFSPNGDGTNDIFKPEGGGHPKEYAMRIYNRWGETVFTTFDLAQGWDGNINGKPADLSDYYYRVSGKCVNGETIDLKGACTLIR